VLHCTLGLLIGLGSQARAASRTCTVCGRVGPIQAPEHALCVQAAADLFGSRERRGTLGLMQALTHSGVTQRWAQLEDLPE
jgi:hypothetical protein